MLKKDLSVIIVTFNSEKYIKKCVDSILSAAKNNFRIHIVLVDNGSTDNTRRIISNLKKRHDNVLSIENNRNVGFAKAVNIGIKFSPNSFYFLLLNPDTILKKQSILNLVHCLEKNRAGICGGKTIDAHGVTSGSHFRFPNIMVGIFDFTNFRRLCKSDKWHKYFYYKEMENKNKSFSVDIVTGGFMLITLDTIKKNGLLDESFFMYLEDADYCMKAKRNGIKIFYCDSSSIMHIGGASSKNKDRIRHSSWIISRKLFYLKNFGLFVNLVIQPIFIIDDIIIIFLKFVKHENFNR